MRSVFRINQNNDRIVITKCDNAFRITKVANIGNLYSTDNVYNCIYNCIINDDSGVLQWPDTPEEVKVRSWDSIWGCLFSISQKGEIYGDFNSLVQNALFFGTKREGVKSLLESFLTYDWHEVDWYKPEMVIVKHFMANESFREYLLLATSQNESDYSDILAEFDDISVDEINRRYSTFATTVSWFYHLINTNQAIPFINILKQGRLDNLDVQFFLKELYQNLIGWDIDGNEQLRNQFVEAIKSDFSLLKYAEDNEAKRKCIQYLPFESIKQASEQLGLSEEDSYKYNNAARQKREAIWHSLFDNYIFCSVDNIHAINDERKIIIVYNLPEGKVLDKVKDNVWDTLMIEKSLGVERISYPSTGDPDMITKLFKQQFYFVFSSEEKYNRVKASLPKIVIDVIDRNSRLLFSDNFWGASYNKEIHDSFFEIDDMLRWIAETYDIPNNQGKISWRPPQEAAIRNIFCRYVGDYRNFLTIIPTGGGKSLIFQGPLLYKATKKGSKKMSIVITPLQALMRDQVEELRNRRDEFKEKVAFIDSNTPIDEQRRIKRLIGDQKLCLLYIAPERLLIRTFFESVINKAAESQGIDSLIFDEAHCITGWGMDFRPDYIFALRKCRELQHKHPGISILLFTATLPEIAKLDLMEEFKNSDGVVEVVEFEESNIIPAIGSKEYEASLCPIRDHIALNIQKVDGIDSKSDQETVFKKKMEVAFEKLFNSFDPELLLSNKSRALIFTRTRAEAEAASHWLQEKLREDENYEKYSFLADHIDFFHAGIRNQKRKTDILEKYKSGEILILFATKAFGLGMNIKNIHFVLHLTPPTYIEDYLQEVGRAARDLEEFKQVFPNGETISAYCLYSPTDIEKYKDRIEKIEWDDIMTSFTRIKDYISNFTSKSSNHFYVVPLNILEQQAGEDTGTDEEEQPSKDDNGSRRKDKTVLFRQCLGWLEKKDGLARIEVGFKCPNAYDLGLGEMFWDKEIEGGTLLYSLIKFARLQVNQEGGGNNRVIIKANDVFADDKIGIHDLSELESLIDEGVRQKFFTRDYMYVNVTLKKQTEKYVRAFVENGSPLAVLQSLRQLLSLDPLLSNDQVKDKLDELLNKDYPGENCTKIRKYINGVLMGSEKENWYFFKQLNQIYTVDEIVGKCETLLKTIYIASTDSVSWKSLEDSLDAADDPNMIRLFLYAIYKLNYADKGGLNTDFIEIKVINSTDITCNKTGSDDYRCQEIFNHFNYVKEMKAGAMFALIEEFKSSSVTKNFIRTYSSISSDNLDNFEPAKRMTAKHKLNEEINNKLNREQRIIYDLPIDKNINVQAGAGSGKTRLLTYRALRLILAENNPEKSILILAYNRAVRDEVEKRMIDYAASIKYTLQNLQIYTFHGFAAKCLPELTDKTTNKKIDFSEWEKMLLWDISKNHPEKYRNKYRYLLIDEFQDVTQTRLNIILELLKLNSNSIYNARAFVIGDKSQSIYGYEKRKDWDGTGRRPSIEPEDYYNQLKYAQSKSFDDYNLSYNYRSYQAIINTAKRWLLHSENNLKLQSQVHDKYEYKSDIDIIEPMEGLCWKRDLFEKVIPEFLSNRADWDSSSDRPDCSKCNPFASIGVLFRTNSDVHDAYSFLSNELKKRKLTFDLRIQGSDIYYMNTREFYAFTKLLQKEQKEKNGEIDIEKIKNWLPEDKKVVYDGSIIEVARRLADILVSKYELKTYSELEKKFTEIAFTERDRLKDYIERENADLEQNTNPKIIVSTIHKVKGMEYDVVVVPPSTYPIGLDSDNLTPEENNMEERRLMYVAFSRAKRRLYYYMRDRETAIMNNKEYYGEKGRYYVKDGQAKVNYGDSINKEQQNEYIANNVQAGDEIILKRFRNDNPYALSPFDWVIFHINRGTGKKRRIGKLNNRRDDNGKYKNELIESIEKDNNKKVTVKEIKGLRVKSVQILTKEEDKRYWAEKDPQKDMEVRWGKNQLGYAYYIDYYGCAEPVEE